LLASERASEQSLLVCWSPADQGCRAATMCKTPSSLTAGAGPASPNLLLGGFMPKQQQQQAPPPSTLPPLNYPVSPPSSPHDMLMRLLQSQQPQQSQPLQWLLQQQQQQQQQQQLRPAFLPAPAMYNQAPQPQPVQQQQQQQQQPFGFAPAVNTANKASQPWNNYFDLQQQQQQQPQLQPQMQPLPAPMLQQLSGEEIIRNFCSRMINEARLAPPAPAVARTLTPTVSSEASEEAQDDNILPLGSADHLAKFSAAVWGKVATRKRKRKKPAAREAAPEAGDAGDDAASEQMTSLFRGVSWHRRDRVWLARAWVGSKIKHLGCFKHEEMAALAVDFKLIKEYGEKGRVLNFPDPRKRQELMDKFEAAGELKLRRFVDRLGLPLLPPAKLARRETLSDDGADDADARSPLAADSP